MLIQNGFEIGVNSLYEIQSGTLTTGASLQIILPNINVTGAEFPIVYVAQLTKLRNRLRIDQKNLFHLSVDLNNGPAPSARPESSILNYNGIGHDASSYTWQVANSEDILDPNSNALVWDIEAYNDVPGPRISLVLPTAQFVVCAFSNMNLIPGGNGEIGITAPESTIAHYLNIPGELSSLIPSQLQTTEITWNRLTVMTDSATGGNGSRPLVTYTIYAAYQVVSFTTPYLGMGLSLICEDFSDASIYNVRTIGEGSEEDLCSGETCSLQSPYIMPHLLSYTTYRVNVVGSADGQSIAYGAHDVMLQPELFIWLYRFPYVLIWCVVLLMMFFVGAVAALCSTGVRIIRRRFNANLQVKAVENSPSKIRFHYPVHDATKIANGMKNNDLEEGGRFRCSVEFLSFPEAELRSCWTLNSNLKALEAITALTITDTDMTLIPRTFCTAFPSLQRLTLRGLHLQEYSFPYKLPSSKECHWAETMLMLDISHNDCVLLPWPLLWELDSLLVLRAGHNRIHSLQWLPEAAKALQLGAELPDTLLEMDDNCFDNFELRWEQLDLRNNVLGREIYECLLPGRLPFLRQLQTDGNSFSTISVATCFRIHSCFLPPPEETDAESDAESDDEADEDDPQSQLRQLTLAGPEVTYSSLGWYGPFFVPSWLIQYPKMPWWIAVDVLLLVVLLTSIATLFMLHLYPALFLTPLPLLTPPLTLLDIVAILLWMLNFSLLFSVTSLAAFFILTPTAWPTAPPLQYRYAGFLLQQWWKILRRAKRRYESAVETLGTAASKESENGKEKEKEKETEAGSEGEGPTGRLARLRAAWQLLWTGLQIVGADSWRLTLQLLELGSLFIFLLHPRLPGPTSFCPAAWSLPESAAFFCSRQNIYALLSGDVIMMQAWFPMVILVLGSMMVLMRLSLHVGWVMWGSHTACRGHWIRQGLAQFGRMPLLLGKGAMLLGEFVVIRTLLRSLSCRSVDAPVNTYTMTLQSDVVCWDPPHMTLVFVAMMGLYLYLLFAATVGIVWQEGDPGFYCRPPRFAAGMCLSRCLCLIILSMTFDMAFEPVSLQSTQVMRWELEPGAWLPLPALLGLSASTLILLGQTIAVATMLPYATSPINSNGTWLTSLPFWAYLFMLLVLVLPSDWLPFPASALISVCTLSSIVTTFWFFNLGFLYHWLSHRKQASSYQTVPPTVAPTVPELPLTAW